MLRALRVSDLAIIDEIELILEPGFNVVTGETGAGKSILLQALDVALGGRPDVDLVRAGAGEAVVEALFEHVASGVRSVLDGAGIAGEAADQLLVRRVIALARDGVPFDRIAVLLRSPEDYRAHLKEAFGRADIPVHFARGAVRPEPAGRALFALLQCAARRPVGA